MAIEITVPRLGWNMEEGVFLAWLKPDGAPIRAGDPLFSLEGDKAAQDVEATDSGILRIAEDAPREGERVAVGAVLGYLLAADEKVPTRSATPTSSPRARRVARELGVDWTRLQGTGRTGRIRERDVRAIAPRSEASPTRQTIARRLLASLHTTAPVTLTTSADATNLVSLRAQFKAVHADIVPGVTDFVVKLTALALLRHPLLNARWEEERIVTQDGIHIGIAVDTDAGLLVPVVRDVPSLGLRPLAARSRELIEKAQTRRLTAAEQQGGTFTVSNLGAFGIDAFTPIINPPECAILGVGRIHRQAAVVDDCIVPREQITLSLTFDHRIVDGAPAARFLDEVRRLIENPGPWLIL
jgi:pyruvate dehydrogenase E2 component (dihydrolipoamide acetyltransferase)